MNSRLSFALACFLGLLPLCGELAAQPSAPAPQISEALAGDLGPLREFSEAKNYPAALGLVDRLLAAAPPDSYDRTLLSQIKAQLLLADGRHAEAIAPLETALSLGESQNYFPPSTRLEVVFLLAQLHQQQSTSAQENSTGQRAHLASAIALVKRWQALAPRPTPEMQLFAATLYYQEATLNPDRPDPARLDEARRAAEQGLFLQIRPNPSLYVLLLATCQQRQDHAQAADLLEFLVEKNPASTGYWQQLVSTYLAQAASAPDEREATRLNLRALLALERAQSRGLLTGPQENFNRVALYLAVRQRSAALALLEAGLADGRIENTRRNWELLANTHQQAGDDARALAATERAVAALPADGQLEFNLAQREYARTRLPEARLHLERAVQKGRLDKPGQARLFLAYLVYELQSPAEAARWAREAAAFDDADPADLARLNKAIAEALRTAAPKA